MSEATKHKLEITEQAKDDGTTHVAIRLFIDCPHVEGGACGPCAVPAIAFAADNLIRYGYERAILGRGLPVVDRSTARIVPPNEAGSK